MHVNHGGLFALMNTNMLLNHCRYKIAKVSKKNYLSVAKYTGRATATPCIMKSEKL